MSMHVCGQTLVLVDNDGSVNEVNQKLVNATLKYMFYHMPDDRAFCLNTYEHDITDEETYSTEAGDLVYKADMVEYKQKDANLTDTLCEVITRWRDSDFACRDILVFTDGLEGGALNHEKEELYYLVQKCSYPVYIVFLDQENNAEAKKGLLSIAVPSGGRLYETEFPGSEAAVDRQLCEKIYGAMADYSAANWKQYEEVLTEEATEEASVGTAPGEVFGNDGGDPVAKADLVADEAISANEDAGRAPKDEASAEEAGWDQNAPDPVADTISEERVVYEYTPPDDGMGAWVISAALIAAGLVAAVFGSFVIMKKRRAGRKAQRPLPVDREEYFEDYELKGMATVDLAGEGDTVFLGDDDERDRATRLLDDTRFIRLTDKADRSRIFRIVLGAPMTIGRGKCDVNIQGDDALSKRHCEIFEKEGRAYVRDLSSANGTKVNNVKINEDILSDGDELTIGSRTYVVGLI